MGFFILTLHFASGDHELGKSGPGIAIEIFYWISYMFTDPVEETISEILLHLSISCPPRALQPDFVKDHF